MRPRPLPYASMVPREQLTAAVLRELLIYDPDTGAFTWRATGKPATGRYGSGRGPGYVQINLLGQVYRCHRLAWLYVHGKWPVVGVDHKNGNKADNRIENLRLATQSQNLANAGIPKTNTSGIKGVQSKHGKWIAHIKSNQRPLYLGTFDDPQHAAAAYRIAAAYLFGEFARAS